MNSNFKIRPIRQSDNQTLAQIVRSTLKEFNADKPGTVYFDPTTDHLYELFLTPLSGYTVLVENEIIQGGAGIFPTANLPQGCCELVKFYLVPESRGKGYGMLLLEDCIIRARNLGFKQIYLESLPELGQGIRLYEKCGFKYLPGPLGNSGHFGCNLWMLKDLK